VGDIPVQRAATSTSPCVVRVSRLLACSGSGTLTKISRGSTSKLDDSSRKGTCPLFGTIVGISFLALVVSTQCFCMGAFFHPVPKVKCAKPTKYSADKHLKKSSTAANWAATAAARRLSINGENPLTRQESANINMIRRGGEGRETRVLLRRIDENFQRFHL